MEPYAEVLYREGIAFRREDVADADLLIIRTRTRCNASLLDGSSVKMIATATIGFDHIDLEYCQKHGIEVVTAQGCNAAGVVGCRIIASPKERLLAIVTNPLIPCNGRFPLLITMISLGVTQPGVTVM